MNAYDLAMKNYGRTWTIEMIAALVVKGKITPTQYEEITGKAYTA
jgi:hypothetical protein